MAAPSSVEDLARSIELMVADFVAAAQREAQSAVERAFSDPRGAPKRSTRAAAPTTPRPKRQRGSRRSADEIAETSTRLVAAIAANPGELMAFYAKRLGTTSAALDWPMCQLKQQGRVRGVGHRNVSRYFPLPGPRVTP